jgi:hypothetical protein
MMINDEKKLAVASRAAILVNHDDLTLFPPPTDHVPDAPVTHGPPRLLKTAPTTSDKPVFAPISGYSWLNSKKFVKVPTYTQCMRGCSLFMYLTDLLICDVGRSISPWKA